MSQAPDLESERARYLRGVHGRTPRSLFALWRWRCGRPHCDGEGAEFKAVLSAMKEREDELTPVLEALLAPGALDVAAAAAFLDSCIRLVLSMGKDQQKKLREKVAELEELRSEAIGFAQSLAATLKEMEEISESSMAKLFPLTAAAPVQLLLRAGKSHANFHFSGGGAWPGPANVLGQAAAQYGPKYWPTVYDLLMALAEDLNAEPLVFSEEVVAAVMSRETREPGFPDLLRGLHWLMQGDEDGQWGVVKLTTEHQAALLSVLMRRPDGKAISAEWVQKAKSRRHG